MSELKPTEKEFSQIEEEAVVWHTRVSYNKLDVNVIAEFQNWMNISGHHRASYDRVKNFHDETENFMDDPSLTLELEMGEILPKKSLTRTLFSLKSVGVLLACVFLSFVFMAHDFKSSEIYETKIAQKSTIILADGSKVLLNTNSQIEVIFTDKERTVKLNRGQGFFEVFKDKTRPFSVVFNGGKVTAIGTKFDVYLGRKQTRVILLKGAVKVERVEAIEQASQEDVILSVDKKAVQVMLDLEKIGTVELIDPEVAVAWQREELIFQDKTLGSVIYELNRYSTKKISLADNQMKDILITGRFSTNIFETLRMLERYFDIKALDNEEGEILLVKGREG